MSKKKSKSYQHKIVEISFDQMKLNNFSNSNGISNMLTNSAIDDRISDLRSELLEEIYEIIHGDYLTEHQKKILFMRLMGKTQNDIAKHLGITQSAVHKAMHGNIDYKNNKKRYGGIVKKLQKICSTHARVHEILIAIEDVKSEAGDE